MNETPPQPSGWLCHGCGRTIPPGATCAMRGPQESITFAGTTPPDDGPALAALWTVGATMSVYCAHCAERPLAHGEAEMVLDIASDDVWALSYHGTAPD